MQDESISREQAVEAADRVMDPKRLERKIEFLGEVIEVRPLPIKWTKRIHALLAPTQAKIASFSSKWKAEKGEDFRLDLSEIGLDREVAQVYLEVTAVLLEFYGRKMELDELEDKVSLDEAQKLITAQLEVNGESDFLLRPLAAISRLLDLMGFMDQAASQILQSLPAFVKSGGLIQTDSLSSTPPPSLDSTP